MSPTVIIEQIELILPKRVREKLRACPKRPNKGVHQWLNSMAASLHHYIGDQDCVAELLGKYSADCGREVTYDEIWDAVLDSAAWLGRQHGKASEHERTPKWPNPDPERIQEVVRQGPTLAELEASSPGRWSDAAPKTEQVIDVLFPCNPLLCAAQKKEHSVTAPREAWRGQLSRMQYVVPSPMTSQYGINKKGKESSRCLANTGPRAFLVVECDNAKLDDQAAIITHLAKRRRLALVVFSGGESLHAWFPCGDEAEDKLREFFTEAVLLGADPITWTRSQLVRMPDGLRDGAIRQRVIYFNPAVMEVK
jgi:hypothetical protein